MASTEEILTVQPPPQSSEVRTISLDITGTSLLTNRVVKDIHAACDAVDNIADHRVLMIRINGQEGTKDRIAWPGNVDLQLVSQWEKALRRVEQLDSCVVALAAGGCSTVALEILLIADYRLGTPDLCIQLSWRDEMTWPGMSMHRLVGRLGLKESRQLCMFGGDLPGARAIETGIVDEIVKGEEGVQRAMRERLKSVTTGGYSSRRQLLFEASSSAYEDALGIHLAACDQELRKRCKCHQSATVSEEGR